MTVFQLYSRLTALNLQLKWTGKRKDWEKIQDILIEVNIGDEASKGGVGRSFLRELLYEAAEMKNIKVCGLMAIPPAENAEKFLCDMQQLYIDISSET